VVQKKKVAAPHLESAVACRKKEKKKKTAGSGFEFFSLSGAEAARVRVCVWTPVQ
jgi:hypothetical protein